MKTVYRSIQKITKQKRTTTFNIKIKMFKHVNQYFLIPINLRSKLRCTYMNQLILYFPNQVMSNLPFFLKPDSSVIHCSFSIDNHMNKFLNLSDIQLKVDEKSYHKTFEKVHLNKEEEFFAPLYKYYILHISPNY